MLRRRTWIVPGSMVSTRARGGLANDVSTVMARGSTGPGLRRSRWARGVEDIASARSRLGISQAMGRGQDVSANLLGCSQLVDFARLDSGWTTATASAEASGGGAFSPPVGASYPLAAPRA